MRDRKKMQRVGKVKLNNKFGKKRNGTVSRKISESDAVVVHRETCVCDTYFYPSS